MSEPGRDDLKMPRVRREIRSEGQRSLYWRLQLAILEAPKYGLDVDEEAVFAAFKGWKYGPAAPEEQ